MTPEEAARKADETLLDAMVKGDIDTHLSTGLRVILAGLELRWICEKIAEESETWANLHRF